MTQWQRLKEWLKKIVRNEAFFAEEDSPTLRAAVAALLHHVIFADGIEEVREKKLFVNFFTDCFGMDKEAAIALYQETQTMERNFDDCVRVIKNELDEGMLEKRALMECINKISCISGITDEEMKIFNEVLDELFGVFRGKNDSRSFAVKISGEVK